MSSSVHSNLPVYFGITLIRSVYNLPLETGRKLNDLRPVFKGLLSLVLSSFVILDNLLYYYNYYNISTIIRSYP